MPRSQRTLALPTSVRIHPRSVPAGNIRTSRHANHNMLNFKETRFLFSIRSCFRHHTAIHLPKNKPEDISVSKGTACRVIRIQHAAFYLTPLCVCYQVPSSEGARLKNTGLYLHPSFLVHVAIHRNSVLKDSLGKTNETKQQCWVLLFQICDQQPSGWVGAAGAAPGGGIGPSDTPAVTARAGLSRCHSGAQINSGYKGRKNKFRLCRSKKHRIHSSWMYSNCISCVLKSKIMLCCSWQQYNITRFSETNYYFEKYCL